MKRYALLILFVIFGCAGFGVNDQTVLKQQSTRQEPFRLNDGLDDLRKQIVESLDKKKKSKIAIMPFSDLNGNASDFGKFLSDELIDQLFTIKKFEIIERLLIDKILEEHKLTLSGLFDPNSAKKIGHILGVDAIATGTYTVLSKSIRVRTRIIDVETAEVFAVAKNEIFVDDNIVELLGLKNKIDSRWAYEPEEIKKSEYDKHIENALNYIKKTSYNIDSWYRAAIYKSALIEIEIALSIYPDDKRCIQMKENIENIMK